MLSLLHIENIAVIELGDIAFDQKLNILTGETGAGKSIVIDALSALLGRRASRDLIRSGSTSAEVSGIFCGNVPPRMSDSDCENEQMPCPLSDENEHMLRRVLQSDGRSLCYQDGKPITLAALRELGDNLVDIHGQHDGQALLREDTHIGYLDAFAGLDTGRYIELYDVWKGFISEQKALSVAEDEKRAKIDMLTYRLNELRGLDPKPGEEETLSVRRKTLRSAESIREALGEAYFALYGDEDTQGACELAETAATALANAARLSPDLKALAERLGELPYLLRDCADEARTRSEDMDASEAELEQIEARLDALGRLRRKHNMSIDTIIAAGEKWEAELDSLESADRRLAVLEKEITRAADSMKGEAAKLTKKRLEAAKQLETRMAEELAGLDMGKVIFRAERTETEPGSEGCDAVRFLIATNAGEPLKPLAKVASGGELARVMLALKNLLAESDGVNTLVFDEVDSGVSGRAAQRVAEKLTAVSRRKQVLCVTHLPQIAAFADSHFHVEKSVEGGRTVTRVEKLDRMGRIEELARLLAGASVTDNTRKAAEELLDQAEACKAGLEGGA